MSSTNRGYDRHVGDFYVTPHEAVKTFLDHFKKDLESSMRDEFADCYWLDPCAGGDEKHEMTYPTVISSELGINVKTIDIREDSKAELKVDYLKTELDYAPKFIITNPPFYLAKEIIIKALKDVQMGGYVIMLLRLNFFGSKDRFQFFKEHMPLLTYVHHRRFSFTDDKKTDSIEYMHAVWKKGDNPEFTKLKVI